MELHVKAGRGSYWKPIEDLFLKVDGEEIKLTDLVKEIEDLKSEIRLLKHKQEQYSDSEAHIDELFRASIELLSKKVARLEVLIEEDK